MEELKQEAIKRLEILKLDSKVINEFKENDNVYVSKVENAATEVILDKEIIDLIKMFEQKKTIKIYHVIINQDNIYMLSVHTNKEIWEEEKSDLKRGFTVIVSYDIIHKGIAGYTAKEAGIETENGNYVPADLLSIGTIDGLYLTLRISSIKELTKENMPIILDETFAYFDSERLENVLKLLDEEYKENQILILTCTERERKALEKLNISYNNIEL